MGIGSAFNIGRSALTASQLGIQTASNNLANAGTPGYARQVLGLSPTPGTGPNRGIGQGVSTTGVRRQVDEALNARLNGAISEAAGAQEAQRVLAGIETTLNELSDLDLSSELGAFYTSFSELANGSQSQAQVIEQGDQLAGSIKRLRDDLAEQRDQLDDRLGSLVDQADALAEEIARINEQITRSEGGGDQNNALRDQRDELVRDLSELMEINVVEQASGAIDVLAGSSPIVLGTRNQGLELREIPSGDTIERVVAIEATSQVLRLETGQIGGVLSSRDGELDNTIAALDQLAGALIYEINSLHATGATADGLTAASSDRRIGTADQSLALNDPLNQSTSGAAYSPSNGGFLVRVQDDASGAIQTTRIDIDLDGIDATGVAGFGDDTSLTDIAGQLNAVSGVDARVTPDGRLEVTAAPGSTFTFGDDSSGVLAFLGVNSYFQGQDATDIQVRASLRGNPASLMTGRYENGEFIENGTSLAIALQQDAASGDLNGQSVGGFWRSTVQQVSARTSSASSVADGAAIVRDSLESERLAISGVDSDEETLDLLAFQRQYQGAARIIQTSNELLDELFAIL